jgi:hypothetical protein
MEKVKIIKLSAGKMIKTQEFEDGTESFFQVMQKLWLNVVDKHEDIFPRDFFQHTEDITKCFWLYSIIGIDTKEMNLNGFDLIGFNGGYYATATAIADDDEDFTQTVQEIKDWINDIEKIELDISPERNIMSQRPRGDDEKLANIIGYSQVEIFVPVKFVE